MFPSHDRSASVVLLLSALSFSHSTGFRDKIWPNSSERRAYSTLISYRSSASCHGFMVIQPVSPFKPRIQLLYHIFKSILRSGEFTGFRGHKEFVSLFNCILNDNDALFNLDIFGKHTRMEYLMALLLLLMDTRE